MRKWGREKKLIPWWPDDEVDKLFHRFKGSTRRHDFSSLNKYVFKAYQLYCILCIKRRRRRRRRMREKIK